MTAPNLLERLSEVAGRLEIAGQVVLGLDFDGTLAPIRPRPEDAALPESVRKVLVRLSALPNVVMLIVSGRGLGDVADRVGLPGLVYAGNHGLEVRGPGLDFLEPTARALVGPLKELSARLAATLGTIPGALVEPKGLTTSVHDRNVAPEFREALESVVRREVEAQPDRFVLSSGHHVWEVRPKVSWHKGQAILWALEHLEGPQDRVVFYFGDDRTDEDAFGSLPDGLTARVGPREVSTKARYRLEGPAEVERFLTWLAEQLSTEAAPPEIAGHE